MSEGAARQSVTMFMTCVDCRTPLEPDDGHDRCCSCLGIDHLRQGLTELACMNCACLSLAARSARLASATQGQSPTAKSSKRRLCVHKRRRTEEGEDPSMGKRRKVALSQKVDSLTSEFAQIKALLQKLQPLGAGSGLATAQQSPPPITGIRKPGG